MIPFEFIQDIYWNASISLDFTKLTVTDPSKIAAETFNGSAVGLALGIFSMQFIKSNLFPERIWPHFDKVDVCFRVSGHFPRGQLPPGQLRPLKFPQGQLPPGLLPPRQLSLSNFPLDNCPPDSCPL